MPMYLPLGRGIKGKTDLGGSVFIVYLSITFEF